MYSLLSLVLGGDFDGLPDPVVGPAPAKISLHCGRDFLIGWIRIGIEQCRGTHNLAGLTVPALGCLRLNPGFLKGMKAILVSESLDSRHFLVANDVNRDNTGSRRHAIQMDGAGTALGDSTSELGACEPDIVAKNPEKRSIPVNIDRLFFAVDLESETGHRNGSPCPIDAVHSHE
jgi:hypothetical protein